MGVGPWGGGGSGEQCEIGVEMAAKSCAMLKRYEFLGETPPNLHHMRRIIGQSCGRANQEGRPPNGSKVLQWSGSSVINSGVVVKVMVT